MFGLFRKSDPYVEAIKKHASVLNGMNQPDENAEPFYELMSGALIWSDETRYLQATPFYSEMSVVNAFRMIFAYRTSLMIDQPRKEIQEVWDLANTLFPDWIGFLPARRTPTPKLLQLLHVNERKLDRCLKRLEEQEFPEF